MRQVPLYAGAEKKSYFKFREIPLQPLTEAEIKERTTILNDGKGLEFADRARLQDPDHEPESSGIRFLKDGGILVTTVTPTPDITAEMANWWIAWHQLDPLRYNLWNPEDHFDVQLSAEDRAQLLDETIPLRERAWGVVSKVTEIMNGEAKPTRLDIPMRSPGQYGYDNSKLGTDACQSILVSDDAQKIGPFKFYTHLSEYLRVGANGQNEWVARWWFGCGTKDDGTEVAFKLPKPLAKIIISKVGIVGAHSLKEMRHLNKVLPGLYTENKDNWLE